MKINLYPIQQYFTQPSMVNHRAINFGGHKEDSFTKSEANKSHTTKREVLKEKMLELDFYKKDARVMSKRVDIFSPKNFEELNKIDFSGFKNEVEERHKYFLLYALEKPQDVKKFLKIIEPIKKNLFAEELEEASAKAIKYIFNLASKPSDEKISLKQYFKLIPETGMFIDGPYEFLKNNGYGELSVSNFENINKILYGKQPKEQKIALEKLQKETGIDLLMDYNLPVENIEYVREFVNIEKANGEEVCPRIIMTNEIAEMGCYLFEDYILVNPIVNCDGEINVENFDTLEHENTHYLDVEKLNPNEKEKDSYFHNNPIDTELTKIFVNKYAIKNRDEFVAEFRATVKTNKIQKHKNEKGEVVYRYPFSYELDKTDEQIYKKALIKVIGLYYKLDGPKIEPSPLAESSSEYSRKNNDFDFLDIKEEEIFRNMKFTRR